MNGHWLRKTSGNTVIIFVHGLLSDREGCWRNENGNDWPSIVQSTFDLNHTGVYTFEYRTTVFSGTYSIGDAVDAMHTHLSLDKVLDAKNLVFVCHSMGGIVSRRFIVKHREKLLGRGTTIGLILVASPSLGSSYANWFKILSRLIGQAQIDALRFEQGNVWLNDLDGDFQELLSNNRLRIIGRELIEDKFVLPAGPLFKQIVEPVSAARYFSGRYKVPDSDHVTIAKPADENSIQHRMLCEFVADVESLVGQPDEVTPSGKQGADHRQLPLRANTELNALAAQLGRNNTKSTLKSLRIRIIAVVDELALNSGITTSSDAPVERLRELTCAGHVDPDVAEKLEAALMVTASTLYNHPVSEEDAHSALLDAAAGIDKINKKAHKAAFQLKRTPSGKFSFQFVVNGDKLLHGDMYFSHQAALSGIASIQHHLQKNPGKAVERFVLKNGSHAFRIHAANGQVVGTSQSFPSAMLLEDGISQVIRLASKASIDDLTTD